MAGHRTGTRMAGLLTAMLGFLVKLWPLWASKPHALEDRSVWLCYSCLGQASYGCLGYNFQISLSVTRISLVFSCHWTYMEPRCGVGDQSLPSQGRTQMSCAWWGKGVCAKAQAAFSTYPCLERVLRICRSLPPSFVSSRDREEWGMLPPVLPRQKYQRLSYYDDFLPASESVQLSKSWGGINLGGI